MGSVVKKTPDKHIANALNEIQKKLDEIIRKITMGEVRFTKKE